jgi:UDP-glucose 4-epimerase
MQRSGVKRLVLASSLSVYDWSRADPVMDEETPLEAHPEARDAYTTAKLRQEQLARELCERSGIALTVLRPPVIWGAGRELPPTIGQRIGPIHVVFGAGRQLPSVHVENCADAFAHALDARPEAAGTFDVVDHPEITARRFVDDHLRRSRRFGLVLPVGYAFTLGCLRVLDRITPGPIARKLPSFCAPPRFLARFKPVRITGARFRSTLGWRAPLTYEQCLDRSYDR